MQFAVELLRCDSLPSRQSAASTLPPNSHGGLWQLLSPPEDGGCPARVAGLPDVRRVVLVAIPFCF